MNFVQVFCPETLDVRFVSHSPDLVALDKMRDL